MAAESWRSLADRPRRPAVLHVVSSAELYDDNEAVSLTASESNSLPTEFNEIVALQLDTAGNAEETELPQNQTLPLQTDLVATSDATIDLAKYAGNGDGQDGEDSDGMLFAMPSGGQVVSAGSFSAWTVPKDPGPGEDYKIVIMVKVPEKWTFARISGSLPGEVIGTDGFSLKFHLESSANDTALEFRVAAG